MQEEFRAKGKKLYFGTVDFEKAFDRVPTEVIRWAMRKLGMEVRPGPYERKMRLQLSRHR